MVGLRLSGITLLAQDIADSIVINIGQMMERFTHRLYRANLHRVRNNHASCPRHSVASFFEPEPPYRMGIAATYANDAETDTLPPAIGEHLEDMARTSYAR